MLPRFGIVPSCISRPACSMCIIWYTACGGLAFTSQWSLCTRANGTFSTSLLFFFIGPATPEIYTLSLHDALPIFGLNPTAGAGDVAHQYFGEGKIAANIRLAKDAVVLLNHLCYASGNSEPGLAEGSLDTRSEEHTSELQSQFHLVCRLLLEKKKKK